MKSEKDLRKKVKDHFGKYCIRIEPARGSTVGMADCVLALPLKLFAVELKFDLEPLNPQQEHICRVMREVDAPYYVLRGYGDGSMTVALYDENMFPLKDISELARYLLTGPWLRG